MKGIEHAKHLMNFIDQAIDDHKNLKEAYKHLNIISEYIGGLVWIKDYDEKKGHVYRYANRAHLEIFFGLNAEDEDYINQIKEKSDTELITEYRVRTQKRHTYGDLCFGSDEYAREQGEAELWKTGDTPVYNFFEMGIIDNKPLILRVSKKPVFKGFNGCNTCVECDKEDGEYCCSIGQAIDITEYFEHEMLDELIKKKLVIKLDNGSYFIRPSKNDPLDFVKKELQI